jgi:hypothetical protein
MKLPDSARAVVEREMITEYLLNSAHPENGGKAAFLGAWVFRFAIGRLWPRHC